MVYINAALLGSLPGRDDGTEKYLNTSVFTTPEEEIRAQEMNQENIKNGPVFGAGYQPYFYQSGRFLFYNSAVQNASKGYLERTVSRYDFTSDLTGKGTWPRGQTVEDIIQKGYLSVPPSEPETALISDKNHLSWMGLSDIISQIRGRYKIYNQNIHRLEQSKCDAVNTQYAIEASRGGMTMSSREAYSLNKRITELYIEQLHEQTRLWQDVSKLRQLLPENARDYLSSYRKLSILNDPGGDVI